MCTAAVNRELCAFRMGHAGPGNADQSGNTMAELGFAVVYLAGVVGLFSWLPGRYNMSRPDIQAEKLNKSQPL